MKKHLLPLFALLAGVLLGLWALALPAPAGPQAPGFSATRAKADVDAVAAAPHCVWNQAALVPVRDHIRRRLEGLGLEVATLRHPEVQDAYGHRYPLENLAAAIPGRSGSSLLLVSHYDSSPAKRSAEADGSRGAADDGYGVAAMLELASRLASSRQPLENGVRFLFTDAEETGLLGAIAELRDNAPLYGDVNLVLNLEARGVKGPAVMFETGPNNLATLRLYAKARRAFAYSFAADVYRRMPNGTDFTVFLARGFPGLNFAVLDDLSYYHNPRDNPGNVSLGSLQHYGEQVLPIVLAYAREPRYAGKDAFAAREDAVYFSWLPGVFLAWSAFWDRVLVLGLAAAFLVLAGTLIARGQATLRTALLWCLAWLGLAGAALGFGLGVSLLAAKAVHRPFSLTYLPDIPHERLLFWALASALALSAYRLGLACRSRSALLGALGLNLAALGATAAWLPGGTFLYSAPLAAALVSLAAADLAGRPRLALAGTVLIVSLYLPVLHLFGLALTFGALGPALLLAALPSALAGALAAVQGGKMAHPPRKA